MKCFSFIFLMLLSSCGQQSKLVSPDSTRLDSLLTGGQIDLIEVVIPFSRTNVLAGASARKYALTFSDTNRIAEPDTTKDQISTEVSLMSGTNKLGWLSQFDNGLWRFGDYSFRLQTTP